MRKAKEDMIMNALVQETLTILKAFRAHYLIFDEFPPDIQPYKAKTVQLEALLPRAYLKNDRNWHVYPLNDTRNDYDFNTWMKPGKMAAGCNLEVKIKSSQADFVRCLNKFRATMDNRLLSTAGNSSILIALPEAPNADDNRYY
jgi:hypothetical protein